MENIKISVIVPIYNGGSLLPRCLDSILRQTHQNLEILLVDDGSTDGTPGICQKYAARDSRIRVIPQKHRGVSAARNAGLDAATGDWIGWVDADDWIEPDLFAYLLTGGTDVTVCGRFEEERSRTRRFGVESRALLDADGALKALLEEREIDNALYDKLWKRELFENIRFPQDQTYEDLAVVWRLFEKAEAVTLLPEQKYHYCRRCGSITGDTRLKIRLDHHNAARQRYDRLADRKPELQPLLEERCVTSAVGVWCAYLHNPRQVRKTHQEEMAQIARYAKPRVKNALARTNYGIAGRLVLRLLPYARGWAFCLAAVIGWLYYLKNGRML